MIALSLSLMLSQAAGQSPVEDGDPVVVAVLPPDAAGLAVDRRALVLDTVVSQLPAGRVQLAPRSSVVAAMAGRASDCGRTPTCRAEVASQTGAGFVVQASVTEPKSSDYAVRIDLFENGVDAAIATFEDSCTICSEADLERIVRERTLDIREALQRHLAPDTDASAPAIVPAEVAPARVPTRTELIRASPLGHAGWGLVGAGIAGTLGGVVLLALQGSGAGCPADPRGGPCIPLVYRTVVPGAVATGVGVALLGAGVGLVVVGKRRDAKRASVRVAPTNAGVVVSGRF